MINLRKEFSNILGKDKEYNWIIIRHMSDKKCICLSQPPMIYNPIKKANEPNPSFRTLADPKCPVCEGSGWIFEEFLFKCKFFYPGFRYAEFQDAKPAITGSNLLTIYLYPDQDWEQIKVNDWMFNIRSNLDGSVRLPIERYRKWTINDQPDEIRLDNNKIEFIKIYAKPAIL